MKKVTKSALLLALPASVQEFYSHPTLQKFFPGSEYKIGTVPDLQGIIFAIYEVANKDRTLEIEPGILRKCFSTVLEVTTNKSLKVKNGVHPISHTLLCFALLWNKESIKDKDLVSAVILRDYLNYDTTGQAKAKITSLCGEEVRSLTAMLQHADDNTEKVLSMKKKDPRVLLSMAIIKNARLISDIGHSEETDVLEKRMIEYKNVMAAIQLQYDSLPLQPSQEWTRGRLNSAFALFNVLCEEAVKEKVGKKVEVEEQTV